MSAVTWVRWIEGSGLVLASLWIMSLNWAVVWTIHVAKKRASSWIPLLGGSLGALGIALLPVPAVNRWWWTPFLLDWGSLPGIAENLIFHGRRYLKGKFR
ncbi:MAG TPA: hypothetical protein VFJ58_12975 [Armatimonadota bacterium]|nr:hypothetical protein [Armatimonadota bacterium]